jgi:RNA polymerase sigma factor (sigma-70 family)
MKQLSDQPLLEQIQRDNPKAFATLLDRYSQVLFEHVYRKIGHREDAEDITQEIFLSFWKNRTTVHVDINNSLRSYLFGSAKYKVIDYYAKVAVQIPQLQPLDSIQEMRAATHADDALLTKELQCLLEKELDAMPERMRKPLQLSREEEMTIREIALLLQISEQSVKNNISSALYKLRLRVKSYNAPLSISLLVHLCCHNDKLF